MLEHAHSLAWVAFIDLFDDKLFAGQTFYRVFEGPPGDHRVVAQNDEAGKHADDTDKLEHLVIGSEHAERTNSIFFADFSQEKLGNHDGEADNDNTDEVQ